MKMAMELKKNMNKAIEYYKKSASLGYLDAKIKVSDLNEQGLDGIDL